MKFFKNVFTAEAAIGLGILILASGLTDPSQNSSMLVTGPVLVFGALACRSARNRAEGSANSTTVRKILEILAIVACAFLVFMQNDLKTLIIENPVQNVVIPVWIFVAFLLASKKV